MMQRQLNKILVTGGAGFIGANFLHFLDQTGFKGRVVNLDLLTYAGDLNNIKDIESKINYRFVKGDIRNQELLQTLFDEEHFDTVVHFAAESHVDNSIKGPKIFLETNVLGTYELLNTAKNFWEKNQMLNAGVLFHHISTDEVWGSLELNSSQRFSEVTPYNPKSPYAASKAAADHLVRAYYHTYNLPITISNCSNNFGPYQFPEKIIPLFATNLLEGKKMPLYGDGKHIRDWIYVEDHIRGIELVLEKGKIGETYLIGAECEISNLELAKKILKILKKPISFIEFVKDRPGHDRRYAINPGKIKKELGFAPIFDFDKALELTVEWYIQNQSWWRRVKTGEYLKYYKKQYATA